VLASVRSDRIISSKFPEIELTVDPKSGFYTPFFSNPPNLVETFRRNVSRSRYNEKGKRVYKSGFGITPLLSLWGENKR
jgi:hypothetical protein